MLPQLTGTFPEAGLYGAGGIEAADENGKTELADVLRVAAAAVDDDAGFGSGFCPASLICLYNITPANTYKTDIFCI